MKQIIKNDKSNELVKLLEVEKIKLETFMDNEIEIVLKMTSSTNIKRYLANPTNRELERIALREIRNHRRNIKSGTAFWVSDVNKMFYVNDQAPFLINPNEQWYYTTINGTEAYNSSINNSNLNAIDFRINAPVLNDVRKPLGVVGITIDIPALISSAYSSLKDGKAQIYFFNPAGEIIGTDSSETTPVKKNINEVFSADVDVLEKARSLKSGAVQTFALPNGQAAVTSIPVFKLYAAAILPNSINDFKTTLTTYLIFGLLIITLILILTSRFVFRLLKSLSLAGASIEEQNQIIMAGINYASEIQRSILPPNHVMSSAFSDYSVIWEPRDIVGGDIYWAKRFGKGSVLCVCDCTGHGTPGALLTMLVMSALDSIVSESNCNDTAEIIFRLDERLRKVFNVRNYKEDKKMNDGCDLAVLFIANDGSVRFSAGNTNVFICNEKKVQRVKGQKIFVGEGIDNKEKIKTMYVPFDPKNKFYIASDGLFDQPGGEDSVPFGYKRFEKLVIANHTKDIATISNIIEAEFERYRGAEQRVDDLELIIFQPQIRGV
ncbi:MAG: SpoIIE family protein phosphatase [Fibromonadaceae bacterium]|nr:SpoIIE family protein phosphatase [Fibromonadaceae bacterium]